MHYFQYLEDIAAYWLAPLNCLLVCIKYTDNSIDSCIERRLERRRSPDLQQRYRRSPAHSLRHGQQLYVLGTATASWLAGMNGTNPAITSLRSHPVKIKYANRRTNIKNDDGILTQLRNGMKKGCRSIQAAP